MSTGWVDWGRLWRFHDEQHRAWQASQPVPENQQELGEEARKLLDNPVLLEALDRVEKRLIETWRLSDPADEEGRERVYRQHWAVKQLRAELSRMIANAKMAGRE